MASYYKSTFSENDGGLKRAKVYYTFRLFLQQPFAFLRIRIRIRRFRMFLCLLNPDPDSLGRGTDPYPDPSSKNSKKTLDSYCFCRFFMTFYPLENDVNVPSKSNVTDPQHWPFGILGEYRISLVASNIHCQCLLCALQPSTDGRSTTR
jgi:hypothetical protein